MNGKIDFLLDTNIVLGFLKAHNGITHYFNNHLLGKALSVSQITHMELLGFPSITQEEEKVIHEFLSFIIILPINDLIANKAINLRRNTKLKLPDAIIAATAIINEATLVTCDNSLITSTTELKSLNPLSTAKL